MAKNKTTYTLEIDAELGSLEHKLATVKGLLSGVLGSDKAPKGLEKAFEKIEGIIDKVKAKASEPITTKAGFSSITKDVDSAQVALASLLKIVNSIGSLPEADRLSFLPPYAQAQIEKVVSSLSAYAAAMDAATTESEELAAARTKLAQAEERVANAQAKVNSKQANLDAAKAEKIAAEQGIALIEERKRKLEELREEQQRIEEFYNTPNEDGTKKNRSKKYAGVSMRPQDIKRQIRELEEASAGDEVALEGFNEKVKQTKEDIRSYQTQLNTANRTLRENTAEHESLTRKVEDLEAAFEADKVRDQQTAFATLRREAEALGINLDGISESYSERDASELIGRITALKTKGFDKIRTAVDDAKENLDKFGETCKDVKGEVEAGTEAFEEMSEAASQQKAFENKIKSFLGIQGAAQLMRAALRDAMQTITELDATMADMAVVTDLNISDYWNQLPEYTQRANDLGLAIGDVYKADTLFYQQGLKTNEVVAISTETMKMASIAGLDTAEATDRMTAALRGFNMELNEVSAQKIADVYSELAAITAADVDEISTAMTKTASIAASAGMEFETTAAFLSQIIETTRESAETAGTAMKTVIARFQELKKSPDEIGEVDGEIVDANAIETALRSVGVSLRDAGGQFRELDDVFLELSSKWDTLDKNTQRYIATIAAGSRQQSRFIAMMSDYRRTTELVTAANNSAGASQEQFEKKAESLEFKINQLKNAWHEFTMGIMESDLVKTGVEILTKFLEIVNKATDGLGKKGFGGALMKIAGIFAIFKMGMKIFNKFETPIMTLFKKVTEWAGIEGFKSGKAYAEAAERGAASVMSRQKIDERRPERATAVVGTGGAKLGLRGMASSGAKWAGEKTGISAIIGGAKTLKGNAASLRKDTTRRNENARMQTELDQLRTAEGRKAYMRQSHEARKSGAGPQETYGERITNLEAAIERNNKALSNFEKKQQHLKTTSKAAWKGISEGIAQAGDALMGIGMGLSMVGGLLSSMGLEEAGSVISDIGQAITMVGGAISVIPPLLTLITSHPIIAVITAFLALVLALTVGIISAVKNSSPEAKLQRATENAEAAGEAAEKATEAYDNLANSFDELGNKYEVLEDLRKGTEEWNKAVQDINSSVLDLISQYPELAGLVENEGGVLTLDVDSDEVQKVLRDAKAGGIAAQGASLGAKISLEQAKREVELNQVDPDTFDAFKTKSGWVAGLGAWAGSTAAGAGTGALGTAAATAWANGVPIYGQAAWGAATGIGAIVGAIVGAIGGIPAAIAASDEAELRNETNRENFKEIAQAFANGETGTTQEEVATWIEEQGIAVGDAAQKMAEEVINSSEEIAKYGESLNAMDAANKAYYQAMATNAQQLIDLGVYTNGQINQMTEVVDEDLVAQYKKQYEDELTQGAKGSDSDEYKQAKNDFAKEVYGENARVDGNKILDEKGEVIREFTDDKAFINEMAAAEATKQAAEAMKEIPGIINQNLSKIAIEAQEAFRKAFEGEDLTKGELESFKQSLGQGIKDETTGDIDYTNIRLMWDDLSDEQKTTVYGGTDEAAYERFEATFTEILDAQIEAFSKADKNIKSMLGETATYSEKLSSAAAQAWTNNLKDIYTTGGDIEGLNNKLTQLLEGMSVEDAGAAMAQINAIDKMSIDSWSSLEKVFEELNLEYSIEALREFTKQGIETANAIKKIDFSNLKNQINNTYSLINKVKGQGRSYGEEDYKSLIAANKDLEKSFVQIGDQFLYVGGSTENLISALEENTVAIMDEANQRLAQLTGMAEIIHELSNNYGSVSAMSNEGKIQYIATMREAMANSGYDIGQLGIEGLSLNTDLRGESVTSDMLTAWADAIAQTGGSLSTYKNQYADQIKAANIQRFTENQASFNAERAVGTDPVAQQHQEALIIQAVQSGGVSDSMIDAYRTAQETGDIDALSDIGSKIANAINETVIASESRDAYEDLVNRAIDAIYNAREKEIENLSSINDSIDNASSKLVSKLQEQINEQRSQRDLDKKKDNLADLNSARMALMATGGGQSEIAALDKDIADAEVDLQDSLVDQALQKLSDENEKAAEQRQHQIALMEAQLELDKESGVIAAEAAEMAKTSVSEIQQGISPLETALGQLLWASEGGGLSSLEKESWVSDLRQSAITSEGYFKSLQKEEEAENQTIEEESTSGETAPLEVAPTEIAPVVEEAAEEVEKTKSAFAKFFTEDIPNWWNTYIAPIFTGAFWQEKWNQIVAWWNTSVAPIFTGEFWSEKFFAMGQAVGNFIIEMGKFFKQLGETIGGALKDAWTAISEFFTVTVAGWWNEHIAPIFTAEFWQQKWESIKEGLANAWDAIVGFFTETIPAWWNENIAPIFTAEFWQEKWQSFVEGLKQVWEAVKKFWNQYIAPVFTAKFWQDLMAKVGQGIKNGLLTALNAVIDAINWVVSGFCNLYNNSLGSFIEGVGSAFGAGEGFGKINYSPIQHVAFETGGLADFTGPAWLDGTPDRPEYVLNADQTERFFALIDVLENMDLNGEAGKSSGDNYFEIEINVEKMTSDYDVEQMANKIRKIIYEDASYRNVNAISLIR